MKKVSYSRARSGVVIRGLLLLAAAATGCSAGTMPGVGLAEDVAGSGRGSIQQEGGSRPARPTWSESGEGLAGSCEEMSRRSDLDHRSRPPVYLFPSLTLSTRGVIT